MLFSDILLEIQDNAYAGGEKFSRKSRKKSVSGVRRQSVEIYALKRRVSQAVIRNSIAEDEEKVPEDDTETEAETEFGKQ